MAKIRINQCSYFFAVVDKPKKEAEIMLRANQFEKVLVGFRCQQAPPRYHKRPM
jgi:hypothetical protein